jgi:hypothetical protein
VASGADGEEGAVSEFEGLLLAFARHLMDQGVHRLGDLEPPVSEPDEVDVEGLLDAASTPGGGGVTDAEAIDDALEEDLAVAMVEEDASIGASMIEEGPEPRGASPVEVSFGVVAVAVGARSAGDRAVVAEGDVDRDDEGLPAAEIAGDAFIEGIERIGGVGSLGDERANEHDEEAGGEGASRHLHPTV